MSAAAAAFDTLKTEASADAGGRLPLPLPRPLPLPTAISSSTLLLSDVFKVLFDFFLEPRYLWAALLAVYLLAAVRGSRAVVLAEFVEVQQGAAPSSLSPTPHHAASLPSTGADAGEPLDDGAAAAAAAQGREGA